MIVTYSKNMNFNDTCNPDHNVASIAGGSGGTKGTNRIQYYSTRLCTEKPTHCPYPPCGRIHPPNICCLCGSPNHRINKCWYIVGMPEHAKDKLKGFIALFQSKSPPFDVSQFDISQIHAISEKSCKALSGTSSKNKSISFGQTMQSKDAYTKEPLGDANELANTSLNAFTSDFLRQGGNISVIDFPFENHDTSEAISMIQR